MSNHFRSPICILLSVFLFSFGCEFATVEEPFGEPWSLKETKALQGQWLDADSNPLEIVVLSKGNIRLGQMTWDSEKKEFSANTDRIQIRHVGRFDFAFQEMKDHPPLRFFLARIRVRDDGSIYWRLPDEKQVLEAIRKGKLTGSLEKTKNKDVFQPHLKCTADQVLKWVEEVGEDVVFPKEEDESPMILRRAEKRAPKSVPEK